MTPASAMPATVTLDAVAHIADETKPILVASRAAASSATTHHVPPSRERHRGQEVGGKLGVVAAVALNGACVPQPQTDGRTTLTVAVNGEGTHATTTRERLLNRGHQFVREHGRIPTLREFRYWRKMILTEFGTFPDYIIALGFQPANNAGVRVPAAPILEAVAEALGMSEIGADPDIGTQVVLGKHLARQLRRMRQQGYVTEKTADEILCRIGRPDLWHTDPRLYGVGCVPFAGPAHAYLPDEAA